MKLFIGKGKLVENNIYKYLDTIQEAKDLFKKLMENNLKGNKKIVSKSSDKIHSFESSADDIRKDIEHLLYGKVLLPEFRRDLLNLLELIDKMPNKCESIIFMIDLQNLKVPKILKQDLLELVEINIKSIDRVVDAVKALLQKPKDLEPILDDLDKIESESDHKERDLIKKLFSSRSIDKADKILLKELILEIGSISDYGENIGDAITILNIKVRV